MLIRILFIASLFTLIFFIKISVASANSLSLKAKVKMLQSADNIEVLQSNFQSFSSTLDMQNINDVKLVMLYRQKLIALGEFEQAKDLVENLLDDIDDKFGDDSFAYIFVSIRSLSLDSEIGSGLKHYFKNVGRLWRKVDAYGGELSDEQQYKKFVNLVKEIKIHSSLAPSKRTLRSIAENLSTLTKKYAADDHKKALSAKLLSIDLFFKAGRDDDFAEQLLSSAELIDVAKVDTKFEQETRKTLAYYFSISGLEKESDKQVLKIANMLAASHSKESGSLQLLFKVDPRYPADAARKGATGAVTLSFDVDEYGRTQNIKVIKIDGDESFAASAKKSLSRWRYIPPIVDGKLQSSQGNEVVLEFSLDS